MKALLKILIGYFFIFSINLYAKTKVTVLADAGYEPYSFEKDGKASGLYYEILKVIFSRMHDYEIEIHTVPWKRGLKDLELNKSFAIYPPYYRPVERPWMHYSEKILDEHISLFCRKDSQFANKKKWPEEFKGMTVAKNSGFIFGEKFENAVKNGFIKTDDGALTTLQNLQKVKKKYADCYINDEVSIKIAILQNSLNDDLAEKEKIIKVLDLFQEPVFLGFAINKTAFPYQENFIGQFNKELKKLISSGEFERIYNNFIHSSLKK